MVALTDPNQTNLLQQSLGGSMADNFAAMALQNQFQNFLTGAAPMPVPQQELPEINIDALRKISDPRIMQMAFNMLMQRDAMRARRQGGLQIGSVPFRYTQLPQEKWGEAAEIEAGIKPRAGSLNQSSANKDLNELAKWQTIAKNATESVYDKNEGETRTRVRPGQERLVGLAERNITAIEKRMMAEAAKELGVPTSTVAGAPGNSVEATMAHIEAVNSLVRVFPNLPAPIRQKIQGALRAGATMDEILAAPDLESYLFTNTLVQP